MKRLGAVRRIKTSEQVARRILSEIRRRDLKPGDMLPDENTMIAQHQVSRGSLREALRLLEHHGMVQLRTGPGGGPMVGELDASYVGQALALFLSMANATYSDLIECLMIIYPVAARRAAACANAEEIAGLLAHSERLDSERVLSAHDDEINPDNPMMVSNFHLEIERISGNPVYSLLIDAIRLIVVDHVATSTEKRVFECDHSEHRAIAERIAAGDGDGAARLMREHVGAVIERHRREIPGLLDAPIRW